MTPERFEAVVGRYSRLCIAVVGDFCLDRYLEIDPDRKEISIETGLPVHNVVRVRAQPGGAGTILNNLAALGVGHIYPVGFSGDDGEGYELRRALEQVPGVSLDHFVQTVQRRTFTYCKPLLVSSHHPPIELNRLDSKNWTPTPDEVQGLLVDRVQAATQLADAVIVLDQVELPETGVVTTRILQQLKETVKTHPGLIVLADSRRGLRDFPPLVFKMNATELSLLTGAKEQLTVDEIKAIAAALASKNGRAVFVSLAERGIVGALPSGETEHVPALPLRGEIDIVGAGDAVSANLTAALAGGATLREALEMADAAASVVIHKLGTTGTASIVELQALLFADSLPHSTS